MNQSLKAALAGVLLSMAAGIAGAAPSTDAQAEIDHLRDYLSGSACEFVRNGREYDAASARAHIDRKYAYLLKRDMVDTAELFIERAASRSESSGKPYAVKCGQATVDAASWFRIELERYRAR